MWVGKLSRTVSLNRHSLSPGKLKLSQIFFRSSHFKPKEIKIPVPWGHIAGLHWNGDEKLATPYLCLHGWKDNAGSFDNLIPVLLSKTKKYQFICIDLPGHGFSSHYPPGMVYQTLDAYLMVRRVIRHFGWSENKGVNIMGHSLGAILGFLFSSTHPDIVGSLIAIDALVPVTFSDSNLAGMVNIITDGLMKLDSMANEPRKSCDKNELFQKMLTSHMFGLDEAACHVLMARAVVEYPANSGKYSFSHDPRVQFLPLMEFNSDYVKNLAHVFESNLLHIKAENGVTYVSEPFQEKLEKWITKSNKHTVRFTQIKKALHHVHLTQPEETAAEILPFLSDAH